MKNYMEIGKRIVELLEQIVKLLDDQQYKAKLKKSVSTRIKLSK